jgi:hypothetical protein
MKFGRIPKVHYPIRRWFLQRDEGSRKLVRSSNKLPSNVYISIKIHSDNSYLSEPKAKSGVGGYVFLGNNSYNKTSLITNGPLLCISTVLKHVVSSVAESEF